MRIQLHFVDIRHLRNGCLPTGISMAQKQLVADGALRIHMKRDVGIKLDKWCLEGFFAPCAKLHHTGGSKKTTAQIFNNEFWIAFQKPGEGVAEEKMQTQYISTDLHEPCKCQNSPINKSRYNRRGQHYEQHQLQQPVVRKSTSKHQ